jgi:hypothetical protein
VTETERFAFVCPSGQGEWKGIDLSLLDPANEDERRMLIEAEHPELRQAIEDDIREIHAGGRVVSPTLHITMHEIVTNQLWANDPPEVWQTAKRLTAAGYERHEVLHMLSSVVASDVWRALSGGEEHDEGHDLERVRTALAALPGTWEIRRDEIPLERSRNRAERRAEERRRRQ